MNEYRPKVSIIVPVYNAKEYLEQSINSVINQSFSDWELILVDDGSTDGSGVVCDTYVKMDNRIKVIHQNNKGVSCARNAGIRFSQGEWIEFLDSDDYLNDRFLDTMLECSDEVDLVVCSMRNFPTDEIVQLPNRLYSSVSETAFDFEFLYNCGFYNSPTTKLYRKTKIGYVFPEDMSLGEDLVFNLRYMANCHAIKTVEDPLYCCRIDTNNSLSKKIRMNISEIWERMIKEIFTVFPEAPNVKKATYKRFIETMIYKYLVLVKNTNYPYHDKIKIMKTWGNSNLYDKRLAEYVSIKHRILWFFICSKNYRIVYLIGLIYKP